MSSLVLYNSAYAATLSGYPGSPALPGIPNGPKLGCTPSGSSKATWVCGFNELTNATFKVDGRAAGSYQADSHGCVDISLSFSPGEVSVNGNAPVPTHAGTNYLIIEGHKTTPTGTYVVGLRLSFVVPHGTDKRCVTTPVSSTTSTTSSTTSSTSSSGSSSTSTLPKRPRFPKFTTSTLNNPTTLAKALETPLTISPNKVILETSLLAAVLAALLSAGALGSIWNAEASGAAGASGGSDSPGDGGAGGGGTGGEGGGGPTGGAPGAPPEPPAAPAAPGAMGSGEAFVPPVTNAFTRINLGRSSAGGGGQ